MKKTIFKWLFISTVLLVDALNAYSEVHVDWKNFLSRHDLVWTRMPRHWYDAPFMGNGEMGLMIYQEPDSNYIRFETGNSEVHDHRADNGLFGKPRLLIGHFKLCPKGRILGAEMRLSLWNGVTLGTIRTSEGEIDFESYIHADEMLMVIKTTPKGGEVGFGWKWVPAEAESPRLLFGRTNPNWVKPPKDYYFNPAPVVETEDHGGTSLQNLTAGGQTAVCWKEEAIGNARILLANITHSYPTADAMDMSRKVVQHGLAVGEGDLRSSHERWWHGFYPKSFVTLPDGKMEGFYWIQLYKLASATRGDRSLIDCTGPWLTVTPWPNAWWNLNVQLTYWPLNASNHLDLAGSLEKSLYDNVDNLRENVPEQYRNNALGLGRFSNFKCQSDIIGIPGETKDAEVGLLTWACHNLWLIYRHKMDDGLLREKLFPLLKEAVNYYLHFLYYGNDGRLHLPATYSPEYGEAEDCNFDLALLRWGCSTLIDIDKRLGIQDPLLGKWRQVLTEMTPFSTDSTGLSIGKDVSYSFSHRHYSHLIGAYPLYILNVDQSSDTKALIKRSLSTWHGKKGALQGYSFTGASSISSAVGDGDAALSYLKGLFNQYLSSTTMYREAGPVLETPLSGAQSILDMLIQGWGNKIRIFPAMPSVWQNAAFDKLLAEGAFEVSAKREGGKTVYVAIKSLAGEPCVIVTDMEEPVFEGIPLNAVRRMGRKTFRIGLKKGTTVEMYPSKVKKNRTILPIENLAIQHLD